jgi:alkylation response protein AidB-like acyl-CoA dehydrogenase
VKHFSEEIIRNIRLQARQIEMAGHLPADILAYIYEHKLFKLFLPASLNGREMPLKEALEIFEEAAEIDGSFGWLLTIGSGGNYFSAYLNQQVSRELFKNEKAVVAGSGGVTGIAEPVAGGYKVNGQWQYCSGAFHSTIFTANCRIPATGTEPESMRSFVFLPEQISIIEDWRAFGMKGTGSHSMKIENAFVPAERTFNLNQPALQFPEYLLYRFPFFQFAETSFAAVALGVTNHILEEAFGILEQNRQRRNDDPSERYLFIRQKFETAQQDYLQFRADFYEAVNQAWQELTETKTLSETTKKSVEKTSKKVARICIQTVQEMLPYLGMAAVTETTLINQLFRDLHTVCQHTVLVSYEDL